MTRNNGSTHTAFLFSKRWTADVNAGKESQEKDKRGAATRYNMSKVWNKADFTRVQDEDNPY